MNDLLHRMRAVEASLDAAARSAFAADAVQDLTDAETAELLTITGRIQQRLEGVQIEAVDVVSTRSDRYRDERMSTAYGCASAVDLIRMLLTTDARAATRLIRAAGLVHRMRSVTSGEHLPARFPALREAMTAGDLGIAGLLAAAEPVVHAARRIGEEDLLRVDAELALLAAGSDPESPGGADDHAATPHPKALPEELAVYAKVMIAYLDPDGPNPASEEDAMQGRFLRVGPLKNGVHPVRGALLPEVAAQLALLQDSVLNPRTPAVPAPDAPSVPGATGSGVRFELADDGVDDAEESAFLDTRTRAQKQHDAFASILTVAAGTDLFPHLGGAAPTLVVTATADDLTRGAGWATLPRTGERAALSTAYQAACAGGVQRVLFDDHGRIVALGTSARIFTALQRRAIVVRDGGCVIPGCTVPASWCEIHHVREHAAGGPTHTDNGVLLCWFHHRTLHLSEWRIRMDRGVPEVRGPAWWDPHQHWHRARSPHRPRSPGDRRQAVPG
ncbi:DUF222 domain-containing protein [Microbacterium sp. NPDC055903]